MGNTDKFDMIANTYDTPERIEIAKLSAEAIREYIVDAKSKHAIDFGCGTGLVGMGLIDEFGSMLFLDTSPNMMERIEQKLSELHIQNADTLCFDLEQETLPSLKADYIFMVQVLLHIPDAELLLARLFDVLNVGGHLIIVDFNKNENVVSDFVHNGFDQVELKDRMAKLGYNTIQSKTFHSGSKLFMGQDASMFVLDARK